MSYVVHLFVQIVPLRIPQIVSPLFRLSRPAGSDYTFTAHRSHGSDCTCRVQLVQRLCFVSSYCMYVVHILTSWLRLLHNGSENIFMDKIIPQWFRKYLHGSDCTTVVQKIPSWFRLYLNSSDFTLVIQIVLKWFKLYFHGSACIHAVQMAPTRYRLYFRCSDCTQMVQVVSLRGSGFNSVVLCSSGMIILISLLALGSWENSKFLWRHAGLGHLPYINFSWHCPFYEIKQDNRVWEYSQSSWWEGI
jgi:hypothetical protein